MSSGFPNECFFIAPIGDAGSETRRRSDNVRDYVVREAVQSLGMSVVRADDIDEPGEITRQVIEHVLGARAAVADLTGANANVFYELGIRHTARLPVVLVVEEDEMVRLPFDLVQMRVIGFRHDDLRSVRSAKDQIEAQVRASLAGKVQSPVDSARALSALAQGSNVERAMETLSRTVDVLARSALETNVIVQRLAHDVPIGDTYELVGEPSGEWTLRFRTSDGDEYVALPERPTPHEIADIITAANERALAWQSGAAVEDPDEGARVHTAENVIRARILERMERIRKSDDGGAER